MKAHIEELKKRILPVLQHYNVARAAIFGSLVRKEDTEHSDIDLLVEFKGKRVFLILQALR